MTLNSPSSGGELTIHVGHLIRRDHLHTLNDFQKLLGDINWLRPFLKISSAELKPLFDILEGESHISSPRALTPAANQALQTVIGYASCNNCKSL